eukprot:1080770-Rhodomonas_salina.1
MLHGQWTQRFPMGVTAIDIVLELSKSKMQLPEFYKKCMLNPRGQFAIAFTVLTSWELQLLNALNEDLYILQNLPASYDSGYETVVMYIMHEGQKHDKRDMQRLQALLEKPRPITSTEKNEENIQPLDNQELTPRVAYFAIPSSDRAILSDKLDMKINPDLDRMHTSFKNKAARRPRIQSQHSKKRWVFSPLQVTAKPPLVWGTVPDPEPKKEKPNPQSWQDIISEWGQSQVSSSAKQRK